MPANAVSRREFIEAAGTAALVAAAGGVAAQVTPRKRPNILYIMTDQQPLSCVAAYGNRQIKTPHMDRIADGVKFQDYYLAAFPCSPSRASMLSGRYPHSHGVMTNDILFDEDIPSLGQLCKAQGYDTAYVGKWHLGGNMYRGRKRGKKDWFDGGWHYKTEPDPVKGFKTEPAEGGLGEDGAQHGFDHWVGGWKHFQQWLRDQGRNDLADKQPGNHNALPSTGEGKHVVSQLGEDYHMAKFFCDETIRFIQEPERKQRPFCAVLSFFGPHLPVCPPEPWDKMYPPDAIPLPESNKDSLRHKPAKQRGNQRCYMGGGRWTDAQFRDYISRYWGYTSYIDHQLGRVLDALDNAGLTEDTIVLFTTDHGDMVGAHGFIYKQMAGYEELTHCPLMIRYDKALRPGTTVSRTVGTVDLLPTLLDMIGAPHPPGLEGRSALPLMQGKGDPTWEDVAICEMSGAVMVKAGDWKFTYHWHPRDIDELYNLRTDPHEMTNLAVDRAHAERVAAMQEMILAWANRTHHPFGQLLRKARDQRIDVRDVTPVINALTYAGDGKLTINLAWDVKDQLDKDTPYWTFVHFVPRGARDIAFRLTQWPETPTTEWVAGKTYQLGRFSIPVPDSAPAGAYEVRVGLYNPKTRKSPRLLDGSGNYRVLGEMRMTRQDAQVSEATFAPAQLPVTP